jgi:predicted transcriptional regulator of viral defense system/very-short-patch-repair endonuclease
METTTDIDQLAGIQGGIVTRAQATAAGLTRHQIHGRVRSGRWVRVANGAYRVFAMEGPEHLVRAATTALPDAVASHFSAWSLHRLSGVDPEQVCVLVHSRTTHAFPGVKVFRCHDRASWHVENVDGVPSTTLARTIVDLASIVRRNRLEYLIDDAAAASRLDLSDVRDVLDYVARKGKPGVRSLRSILDDRLGDAHSMSALERKGMALLQAGGIQGFTTEYPIPWSPERRFDVAFPRQHLSIEWDSRRWHLQAHAFSADRERDRAAIVHGWRVLRFTWDDVVNRPDHVLDTVRASFRTT